jgi:hypothetical protein
MHLRPNDIRMASPLPAEGNEFFWEWQHLLPQ